MYEVRRVIRFNQQLDALRSNFHRLDEPIEMMEIVLRRDPAGRGSVIDMPGMRFIRTKPFPGVPELIVFFRIDEDEKVVFLLQAEHNISG